MITIPHRNSSERLEEETILNNIECLFDSAGYKIDRGSVLYNIKAIIILVDIHVESILLNSKLRNGLEDYKVTTREKNGNIIGLSITIPRKKVYPLYYYSIFYLLTVFISLTFRYFAAEIFFSRVYDTLILYQDDIGGIFTRE